MEKSNQDELMEMKQRDGFDGNDGDRLFTF